MQPFACRPPLSSTRESLMLMLAAAALIAAQLDSIKTVAASTPDASQGALAESASPPVGRDATIYVIGPQGYRKVRDGRNVFTCLISRERRDTLEPECFAAEGTATVVPVRLFIEAQRAAGAADDAINKQVDE